MTAKLILLAVLCAGFSSGASGQGKIHDRLSGQWEGTDTHKETGSLNFRDSLRISISFVANEFMEGTYRLDTTKAPMKFDITIGKGSSSRTLKGLLALLSDNTLKWQVFPDGKRPDQFVKDMGDNTILLKKKD